ncbi:MAG: phosphotransferase [Gaiellaceae bacterium]
MIAPVRPTAREDASAPDRSPFVLLAYPLLPAEPGRHGVAVEAPPDWSFEPAAVDPAADVIVWGRMPAGSAPLAAAARRAALREVSLRTMRRRLPSRLRVAAVHRLPPRGLRMERARGSVRAALRGGALVELSSAPDRARVLDAVAEAAGVRPSGGSFHGGAGGVMLVRGLLADGSPAVLRVARAGAPGDPATVAGTLERLSRERVPLTPRLHARGSTAGASWVAERALPGRRPPRASVPLMRQVADVCASLPRSDRPPAATAADLSAIAAILPDRAGAIGALASEVSGTLETLPSILRHGDLWAGNLLVDRAGSLCGLVDWDAAHPDAVPGADLLQLVATEFRRASRRALGPAFLARPWRLPEYGDVSARYWSVLGVAPRDDVLDAVGVAWWATEVHGTLARLPHRAADEGWVETNVDRVLTGLGY